MWLSRFGYSWTVALVKLWKSNEADVISSDSWICRQGVLVSVVDAVGPDASFYDRSCLRLDDGAGRYISRGDGGQSLPFGAVGFGSKHCLEDRRGSVTNQLCQ
jgi:hypothetical protein